MNAKDVKVTVLKKSCLPNAWFEIAYQGVIIAVRIYFTDKSRKNSTYNIFEAREIYFEGTTKESQTVLMESITDLVMWCERYKGWILEKYNDTTKPLYKLLNKEEETDQERKYL